MRPSRRQFLRVTSAGAAAALTGVAPGSVFGQARRALKIGYVSPQTGPLAGFGEADSFVIAGVKRAVSKGLTVGGASHPVEILVRDSQSDPNRAAEVAKELIVRDKIDLMLVGNTPETTNPVCTEAEIEEVATISSLAPWQPWFFGQQGNPGQPRAFNYVDRKSTRLNSSHER